MENTNHIETEEDVKRRFIERQKRLFYNILRRLENGTAEEWLIENFKSRYKEIVYDDARKAYTEYRLKAIKKKERAYDDELFSDKV